MRASMKLLLLWSTGTILAGASGCVLPVPHYGAPSTDRLRQNVVQELRRFPEPGVSTREDVLIRLGEPDRAETDEGRFFYEWNRIVLVWGIGGYFGGMLGWVTQHQQLAVDFDAEGIVTDCARETLRTWHQTERR
jgi:hypothetical protein